ncbi:hypothetical protein SNEBB_008146 [Seison nebaliae]|nr:hypothetical protein SNEBB_008146 [Seison nebaliae]
MNYRITFYILLLVVVAIEGIDWAKYEESIKNLQLNQTMLDYYKEIYSEEDGLTSKFNCPPLPKGISGDTVHNLTPMDIKVIGAIGDSLTAGNGASAKTIIGCLTQYRGTSWSVGGDDDVHKRTTLPNILRFYNPTLYGFSLKKSKRDDIKLSKFNLAYPGNVASDMLGQAKMLVDRMTSDPVVDMKSDWKIVSLFIGGNDLCDVCNEPEKLSAKNYVKHIEEALDYLHENLPKTFVNLVNVLDVPLVQQLNYKHFFCPLEHFIICKCGAYPKKSQESSMQDIVREYQYEVENLIADGRYDTKDDFTVVVQPFMTYMEVPKKKNGKADMSYFAPDCFHFSAKGQAAAGEALWNNMLEPIGHKRRNWTIGEIFKCPNESFPYFYTSKNSVSLHMNKRLSVNAGHQIPARTGQKHSNKFALTFSIIGIIACTVVAIGVVIARKHSRNARNSHLPLVDELATNYNVPTEENIFVRSQINQ